MIKPPGEPDPTDKAYQTYLDTVRSLAQAYLFSHRHYEGIRLHKEILAARDAAFSPDSPEVLKAVHDLSEAYRSTANGTERNKLLRRVIDSRIRTHGEDSLEVAQARYDYEWANARANNVRPLIPALERIRDKRVGDALRAGRLDAPAVYSISQLGAAHLLVGNSPEAIECFAQSRSKAEELWGRGSPPSLGIASDLATAYHRAGRWKDAIRVGEEIHTGFIAHHGGENHRDVLRTGSSLAADYRYRGFVDKALPLHEKCLAIGRKVLPPNERDMLGLLANVASTYEAAGKRDRALELRKEAVAGRRVENPVNPDAMSTDLVQLGQTLLLDGRPYAAEAALRESLAIRRELKPDDWRVFEAESLLGEALLGQRNFREAKELLVGGYEGMKARMPSDDGHLPEAANRVIALYVIWGKRVEADKARAERALYPIDQAPAPHVMP